MRFRYKALILVGLFLGLIGLLSHIRNASRKLNEAVSPILKDNEKEKIVVDTQSKTVTVVSRDGNKQVVNITEGTRNAVITEDNQGHLSVWSPTHGFVFEPGISVFTSDRFRVGGDVQWYYWRSYGVLTGVGVNLNGKKDFDEYIAVSYNLPFHVVSDISIFTGYSVHKNLVFGLRDKF